MAAQMAADAEAGVDVVVVVALAERVDAVVVVALACVGAVVVALACVDAGVVEALACGRVDAALAILAARRVAGVVEARVVKVEEANALAFAFALVFVLAFALLSFALALCEITSERLILIIRIDRECSWHESDWPHKVIKTSAVLVTFNAKCAIPHFFEAVPHLLIHLVRNLNHVPVILTEVALHEDFAGLLKGDAAHFVPGFQEVVVLVAELLDAR
mmetsp:Transcript_88215/g.257858  ORF Transcript_88215/g.257858 Transcript_88215/m.257858 type:complete len:218 (-) Transcript_88215:939-1592(-)